MRHPSIAVVVLALTLVGVCACTKIDNNPAGPSRPTTTTTVPAAPTIADAIEFRVIGFQLFTAVQIRHLDPDNGLTIVTTTPPYFATATSHEPTAFVFIEAAGFGVSVSTLQVQIFVNGRIFREGSAFGSVLLAQASGTIRH